MMPASVQTYSSYSEPLWWRIQSGEYKWGHVHGSSSSAPGVLTVLSVVEVSVVEVLGGAGGVEVL